MVFVDFSNPWLRGYLKTAYLPEHERKLAAIQSTVAARAAIARASEVTGASESKAPARPLAAVLDIDEIVLANIHMNAIELGRNQSPLEVGSFCACDYYFAPDGRAWPRGDLRLNPLLPGAKNLIAAFLAEGIEVFFITGRAESLRSETVENFVFVGLAGGDTSGDTGGDTGGDTSGPLLNARRLLDPASGQLTMCPDSDLPAAGESIRPFKEARRGQISQTHRILMNIGDQVSDLGYHGDYQILVPHPFYRTA